MDLLGGVSSLEEGEGWREGGEGREGGREGGGEREMV